MIGVLRLMPKAINNRQKIFTKRDFMADLKKVSQKINKPKPSPKPLRFQSDAILFFLFKFFVGFLNSQGTFAW